MDVLGPAERVYDAVLARLAAATPKFPKIERKYLAIGEIDYSTRCTQFSVAVRQVYAGKPGQPSPLSIFPHDMFYELSLELGIAYTNCWPVTDGILSATKEDAAAREIGLQCSQVLTAIDEAYQAKEIADSCGEVSIGPAVFVGPEGGVAGVTVLLTLQLN